MAAKKAAMALSILLLLIGMIDFVNRLTLSEATVAPTTANDDGGGVAKEGDPRMLDEAAITQLLSWSDIKPKEPVVEPVVIAPVQAVVTPPVVVAPPTVDTRKVVAAQIVGDPSKYLIGDDLLSLKGLFYDGKDFAAVEIENINTKVSRYITFTKDKATDKATGQLLADYRLLEIGKYHVVLTKDAINIKLQLFE